MIYQKNINRKGSINKKLINISIRLIIRDKMEKVKFEKLFYENDCNMYKRGRFLLKKYSDIPKEVITSHNNIPSLRAYENKQFPKLKNYLILGKRKTHKYVINHKISNFLVPFTSSGCYAMCQYC